VTTLVFATGGSGGHIYPAIAVAEALEPFGYRTLFVGDEGGMEARIVPEAGFPFAGVRAGKWHRGRPDPRQALRALLGLMDARRTLQRERPAAVVGFGGFASFPTLAAAVLLRLPIALHEQNVLPGRVTRLFAARAALVAVARTETRRHLMRARRIVDVGLPIREGRMGKREARERLSLPPDGLVTLVMGGSQGSLTLNEAVPNAYRQLPEACRRDHTVLHACGERWAGQVDAPDARYRVVPYLDAALAWAAADLAITRAGMSTVAEAAYHGVPLVMVPLPSAADDHQRHNALSVEEAGAGRMLPQSELERLPQLWCDMLQEDVRFRASAAARARSPEGAAAKMAHLIDELVRASPAAARTAVQEQA
jgi:UDP-N-acetylglucosamine--N-acetylmuramyl-(pentapeptide) pyrophosphoryl-undecaprenol N-acetylglucosamine transferase